MPEPRREISIAMIKKDMLSFELAHATGISENKMSRIIRGHQKHVPAGLRKKIANALSVSEDRLFKGEELP